MTTKRKILLCGNEVIGEGGIIAGCRHYFGYPITPQNELTAYMARRMPEVGGTFIQSESELAAINMVFGASVAGARAMTSSSSPGISLMQEGISYMAGCELPAVIVNVMRAGPGLGGIGPSQSDYFQATKGGGHGDYHIFVLAPENAQEMIDLIVDAFDLADTYRTPAMVLTDGMLGQMSEPVVIRDDYIPNLPEKPWALRGCADRPPQLIRSLLLDTDDLEAHNEGLQEKYRKIRATEKRFELFNEVEHPDILIVAFGSMARISKAAVLMAHKEGIRASLFRPITLYPYPYEELRHIAGNSQAILVIEMSAGQMMEDVQLAVGNSREIGFHGRTGGNFPSPEDILAKIRKILE